MLTRKWVGLTVHRERSPPAYLLQVDLTASIRAAATTTAFASADIDQTERTQAGRAVLPNSALGVASGR